ncbi:uncharacterized protein A1O9_08412 [Exophiala aquamarina CBS 119918]|uniref:Uncharacterized protein n=1 Tax=Exophiala aquamarina CBS 119918 TaxID=1182545 RepID=A0A072P7G0_9EURO|nr:uncharacterized protein A1O9_08412 [Exophiala aquamarina CBS 119918]KEF55662.1 hypothetical protein A1O9_08412 [Exophiala aquamarina CBS 119918]
MIAKVPVSLLYQPLDTNTVASHVSRFPAALSHTNDFVTSTLKEVGSRATEPGSRARAKVKVRHTHPVGDPFAIAHCTTDHERLPIVGRILEILWIHDDITEELSIDAAQSEHISLADMLRLDIDPTAFEGKPPHQKLLAEAVREAIDFDPIAAPAMLSTMAKYLKTYDHTAVEFDSMEQYIPFRVLNVGYW